MNNIWVDKKGREINIILMLDKWLNNIRKSYTDKQKKQLIIDEIKRRKKYEKMIRIIKMSKKFYGMELPKDESEAFEEVQEFLDESYAVLIANNLEDVEEFGINPDEVIMIERER